MKIDNAYFPHRFRDEVALVVGGAQGIGKAIAGRLAREGAQLVVADIDRVMMAHTSKEIAKDGSCIRTVDCDVRSRSQVARMVQRIIHRSTRIVMRMYV